MSRHQGSTQGSHRNWSRLTIAAAGGSDGCGGAELVTDYDWTETKAGGHDVAGHVGGGEDDD